MMRLIFVYSTHAERESEEAGEAEKAIGVASNYR
jgi:hypothetical protein